MSIAGLPVNSFSTDPSTDRHEVNFLIRPCTGSVDPHVIFLLNEYSQYLSLTFALKANFFQD